MEPITMAIIAASAMQVSKSIGSSKTAKSQIKLMRGQMEINNIVADVNKSQIESQKQLGIKNQIKQFEKVSKESEKMYARNVGIIAATGQKRSSSAAAGAMQMAKTDYYSNAQQIIDNVDTIKQNAVLGKINIDTQTASQNSQLAAGLLGVGQQTMNQMMDSAMNIAMMSTQLK